MNKQEILEKLAPIFSETFEEDIELTPNLSAADVENWDSLGNIRFIVAIEQKFSIQFTTGEIANLKNVGELVDAILSKY